MNAIPRRTKGVGAAPVLHPTVHTRWPHTVTLDGYAASHRTVREFSEHSPGRPITIRSSKYLNDLIEQDHRAIKSRVGPMLDSRISSRRRSRLPALSFYIAFGKGSSRFASSESQRRRRRRSGTRCSPPEAESLQDRSCLQISTLHQNPAWYADAASPDGVCPCVTGQLYRLGQRSHLLRSP